MIQAEKVSESHPTRISEISAELRAMWSAQATAEHPTIRARTHNLVVYVDVSMSASEVMESLIALTAERPGRVIVVDEEPGNDHIDAWASLYCTHDRSLQVCGEMINIVVGGKLVDEAHTAVLPLLAPDLPVMLWWEGDLEPGSRVFDTLTASADRLVIDSGTAKSAPKNLPELASLPETLQLGDLDWARTTPWRRMLSHLWSMAHLRPALDAIQQLEIEYAAGEDASAVMRALLLTGWLMHRLGWQLRHAQRSDQRYELTLGASASTVKVHLIPDRTAENESGTISRMAMQCDDNKVNQVTLRCEMARGCMTLAIDPGDQRSMFEFESITTAQALAEELDFGVDPDYLAALAQSAAVISELQRGESG